VCNFTPVRRMGYSIGAPWEGRYETVFNSDDIEFGGEGKGSRGFIVSEKIPMHNFQQSITLDLPPLGILFLKAPPAKKRGQGSGNRGQGNGKIKIPLS